MWAESDIPWWVAALGALVPVLSMWLINFLKARAQIKRVESKGIRESTSAERQEDRTDMEVIIAQYRQALDDVREESREETRSLKTEVRKITAEHSKCQAELLQVKVRLDIMEMEKNSIENARVQLIARVTNLELEVRRLSGDTCES